MNGLQQGRLQRPPGRARVARMRDDDDFKRAVRERRDAALRIIAAKEREVAAYDVILGEPFRSDGPGQPVVETADVSHGRNKHRRGGGLPEAVAGVLGDAGTDLGFAEVVQGVEARLGPINHNSLRGVLSRMQQEGVLDRQAGRGRYRLALKPTDATGPTESAVGPVASDGPTEGGEALWSPRSA